jgi:hypothetical protein
MLPTQNEKGPDQGVSCFMSCLTPPCYVFFICLRILVLGLTKINSWVVGVAQMVEGLPNKHDALISNPSTIKKGK